MFRQMMMPLVLALAMFATASPEGARADGPAAMAAKKVKFAVSFRKAGDPSWTRGKEYPSREAADIAADVYRSAGLEVKVDEVAETPAPASGPAGVIPSRDVVSLEQAGHVFEWMAAQDDISFGYANDGCYARAHLMIRRMQAMGLTPGKAWAFARSNEEMLHVTTRTGAAVRWSYHNAPTLKVRGSDGSVQTYVIDPALFGRPVTLEAWKRAMIRPGATAEPHVTETKLGEAPKAANGGTYQGTGYWPGADPAEGLDAHAVAKMKEFNALLRK